jgi:hypothetical protein
LSLSYTTFDSSSKANQSIAPLRYRNGGESNLKSREQSRCYRNREMLQGALTGYAGFLVLQDVSFLIKIRRPIGFFSKGMAAVGSWSSIGTIKAALVLLGWLVVSRAKLFRQQCGLDSVGPLRLGGLLVASPEFSCYSILHPIGARTRWSDGGRSTC